MKLDGEPVSVDLGFSYNGSSLKYKAAYNPAFRKLSPGWAHFSNIIEQSIAEKNTIYDFLYGDYDYKSEWATGSRQVVVLKILGPRYISRVKIAIIIY